MAGEGSKGWGGHTPNAPVQRIKSSCPEKPSLYPVSPAYMCQVWTAHEYSRFSRNFVQAMMLLPELKSSGVRVMSVTEPNIDLDTTYGLFMGAITHASNEVTSRKISEHVKKGCKSNVQTRDPETGLCYKNGGKPLWGYKAELLQRGIGKGGRPEYKRVWVLDDTVVAGKPLHEWTRKCRERRTLDLVGRNHPTTFSAAACSHASGAART